MLIRSARRVSRYAGIPLQEAMQLRHDFFLLLLKEAWIEEMQSTEKGREYLKKAERLTKTSPDYDTLRNLPGYAKEVMPDGSRDA